MLRHADVGKLLTVDSEDPLVLSLYLEMPQYLPRLREVPDRSAGCWLPLRTPPKARYRRR
jgi:hypothetical protein